ncbi:hypothetical protein L218DRAFT_873318, partial [Marasmius fiardii PR-910]
VPNRPPIVKRDIVSQLSPKDMMAYAMLNRESHAIVKDLQRAAFRTEKILSPFFNPEEIVRFRQVQRAYKFLISGSTALSVFTREVFPEAYLDVYIHPSFVMVLILLLESMGFIFQAVINTRRVQSRKAEDAVEEMLVRVRQLRGVWRNMEIHRSDDLAQYDWSEVLVDVFNFERNGKKIQVIPSRSPLAAVLTFHSTAVMNIISHSHAISLYLRLTFYDGIAVRNSLSRVCSEETVDKWTSRGYVLHKIVHSASAFAGRYSALEDHIIRRPGDIFCWTVGCYFRFIFFARTTL